MGHALQLLGLGIQCVLQHRHPGSVCLRLQGIRLLQTLHQVLHVLFSSECVSVASRKFLVLLLQVLAVAALIGERDLEDTGVRGPHLGSGTCIGPRLVQIFPCQSEVVLRLGEL